MRLIFLQSLAVALLCQFASASTVSPAAEDELRQVTTVYPSRLIYYLNEELESADHDLDTRVRNQAVPGQDVHLAQANFQLEAFGSTFTMDLMLNNDLLSSEYEEIHYEDGKPIRSKGGEHCYYHGQLRGKEYSRVALSTCNGLHGMFDDGEFVYLIEPLRQTHTSNLEARAHTLLRSSSLLTLGDTEDSGVQEMEKEEGEDQTLSDLPWLRRRRKRAVSMHRNVFAEMKYFEIMIVSDHNTFKRHKSRKHTRNFAKSVVNLVDAIFKEQLNTRVVLVAVEIWTDKDLIPLSVQPLEMLKSFSKYRQQSIHLSADAVHLFTNMTFHYVRSSVAYIGGVCSAKRGVGVNEYGTTWTMAVSLSQSLAQNLGIQWDPTTTRKKCGCMDSWVGCIMEDTGVQHPRRFSKCSISDFKNFLLRGGASCLFNRPNKLFEPTECGNGYVEVGEECDCGARMITASTNMVLGRQGEMEGTQSLKRLTMARKQDGELESQELEGKQECYKDCCKKCSLSNGAHCSDGPCCNITCLFIPRGTSCREAVNDCDITESCTGDSGQCPPNLHMQDGYSCQVNQGRCYGGECKTRENQCKYIWGSKAGGSEKYCYEKLNTEGTEKGNCGHDGDKWLPCSKHDVFCGYLLCSNIGRNPRIGNLKDEITPTTFNHQGRLVDCSGGHVILDDDTDLGYVDDGTPCGPSMMCLDQKCLPISSFNFTACPSGPGGRVCSAHGVCNNEATCSCHETWAGTDCSMHDPPKEPPTAPDEGPKGPSATNLIIGSIAGAILMAAIVLGGTGWGFKNVKKRRYDPNASAI
ncbi:disintegrin and metalloproteinase domain-containing protein 23 isoform X1 [Denticeps clupeoides]|uniref:disintegrin and metalloproteinase domain-containing protein 23 isoform X1 n=1 Tax=Denticeps clupeoides TaxID=299321 RepID=UPI0010A2AAB0|nr:disintegrin and metalloproteinase domain-containing protein 23 isoform X1 [Denticeps clupeoides]